jgi:hypothetical protein
MRSSLLSISSKRRRISETQSWEIMTSPHRSDEAPAATSSQGPSWQSGIEVGLFTLRWREKCVCSLLLPHRLQADASYMDPAPPSDLLTYAKYLLLEATGFSLPQHQAWQSATLAQESRCRRSASKGKAPPFGKRRHALICSTTYR